MHTFLLVLLVVIVVKLYDIQAECEKLKQERRK